MSIPDQVREGRRPTRENIEAENSGVDVVEVEVMLIVQVLIHSHFLCRVIAVRTKFFGQLVEA